MRASELKTLSQNFMFWDKDLCRYAKLEDVKRFVDLEDNVYGTDYELRMQCLGRFQRLSYTGMNDKNNRPIYEGHVVKATYKFYGKKIVIIGVIGFEKASFVIVDAKRNASVLSAFDSNELRIIGNIFEHPELMEVKNEH